MTLGLAKSWVSETLKKKKKIHVEEEVVGQGGGLGYIRLVKRL